MREVIDRAPWLAAAHETIKEKRRPRDKSTVADRLGSKSGSAPKSAPTPRALFPARRRRCPSQPSIGAAPGRRRRPEPSPTASYARRSDHQQVREELVMQYRETQVAAERRHRAFLGALEVISRALLQASDAGAVADVETMLGLLRHQAAALTPWADARICTSCWHVIGGGELAQPGRDHRGICEACREGQRHADDPPSDADLWDGGEAILGEN